MAKGRKVAKAVKLFRVLILDRRRVEDILVIVITMHVIVDDAEADGVAVSG